MNAAILTTIPGAVETDPPTGYLIGIAIALLVFGYLVYFLVKPEKF